MSPLAALVFLASAAAVPSAGLDAPGFGRVALHRPAGRPARVVVHVSGARGAEDAVAGALAARGALVVGVDGRAYLASRPAGRCAYPAGDLEALAQHVEKVEGLEAYLRPVLVGRSEGAAIAWAAVAQGPAGTFTGAVLIGPCPARPLPLALCPGLGPAPRKLPSGELPALARPAAPVEVIAAGDESACPAAAAETLAAAIGARLAASGAEGTPPLVRSVADAAERLPPTAPPPAGLPASLADLPLVEVPARAPGTKLAVLLTGDGGWVAIDKELAAALADAGVAVVGLDSLRYFWKRRTPEETARDVARILERYGAAWGREEVLLVGYSRGADLVPFVAARLPPALRARVRLVAMLGPATFAEFEVHAVDLFSSPRRAAALSTEEAVRATLGAFPVVCVHGAKEKDSLCPRLADLPWVKGLLLPGGHHFGLDYRVLAARVLDAAR